MAGQVWCPQGKEREEACGQVSLCGFLNGHFPAAAPFAEACQPSGYHVCDGVGLVHACLAMLGGMCQYDPECPVHRHRPGTTCMVVYRKQKAAEKAAEQARRDAEQARRDEESRKEMRNLLIVMAVTAVVAGVGWLLWRLLCLIFGIG